MLGTQMYVAYELWVKQKQLDKDVDEDERIRLVGETKLKKYWNETYKGIYFFQRTHADSCTSCTNIQSLLVKAEGLKMGSKDRKQKKQKIIER